MLQKKKSCTSPKFLCWMLTPASRTIPDSMEKIMCEAQTNCNRVALIACHQFVTGFAATALRIVAQLPDRKNEHIQQNTQ